MKKYILLASILLTGVFSACDYNERNFGDNLGEVTDVRSYSDTITASNGINQIITALRANKNKQDSVMADNLNTAKMFSEGVPAATLIPYFLKSKYKGADVGSSSSVVYEYNLGRDSIVSALSTSSYTLSDADYKLIWGDQYVAAFTPETNPETSIPTILNKNVSSPEKGDFTNVEYYYSSEEPAVTTVENIFIEQTLEDHTAGSGVLVSLDGWINKDLKGSIGWQCRVYSNNNYAQVSANGSGSENDVWLITKAIDLSNATAPEFTFDITVGYFNANCLSVLVSENFDGNEANIQAATWTDATGSFTIPEAPASGYGTLSPAGTLDMSSYKGKKVYIAFRYQGDDTSTPKKTTTYQIDNIKVAEKVVGIDVKEKSLQYAAYEYDGSKWAIAGDDIVTLQLADYTAMGLTYLSRDEAKTKLPNYLRIHYPYAEEGDAKYVVYKTARSANYADKYTFTDDVWVISDFIEIREEQFVLARVSGEKEWIFDPTIVINMQDATTGAAEYQVVVDYVRANQAVENPDLSIYADSEYYYGFSARYRNVSYRDKDRSYDPLYPVNGTSAEKEAFCNTRTIEGIQLYLGLKYPNAQPLVNGVVQKARITVLVYSSHIHNVTNQQWEYTFECVGDKDWKFIQRESGDIIETAE